MDTRDVIRECAGQAGKSMYQISLDMGKTKQYMSALMTRKSTPQADTLARILATCGFALCAVPHDAITDDMYEITQTRKVDQ